MGVQSGDSAGRNEDTEEMCREAFNANPDLGYEHCAIISFMPFSDVVLECLKDSAGGTDMTDLATVVRPEVMDRRLPVFLSEKTDTACNMCPYTCKRKNLR